MPHIYSFDPPVKTFKRDGPLVKLGNRLPPKELEKFLIPSSHEEQRPYRGAAETEKLLDDITFGVKPKDVEECILAMRVGMAFLHENRRGIRTVAAAPFHLHETNEKMQPEVLVEHSRDEMEPEVIHISFMDELSILHAALLRKLGHKSYLSTIVTDGETKIAGVLVVSDESAYSYSIFGRHPNINQLIVFNDKEVGKLLFMLRAYNDAKKLIRDMREGNVTESEGQDRYRNLLTDVVRGSESGHYLRRMMNDVVSQLSDVCPALADVSKENLS